MEQQSLWAYRVAVRATESAWSKLVEARTTATKCTAVYSSTPGGGGCGDKLQRDCERIERALINYQTAYRVQLYAYRQVEHILRYANTVEEYMLLYQRYIGGETIAEIAQAWRLTERRIQQKIKKANTSIDISPR